MNKQIVRVISVLFHPMFMPIYGLLLIFNADSYLNYGFTSEGKRILYVIVGIFTVVMPAVSVGILVRNGMVSSVSMPHRNERSLPYLITIFYYAMLYVLLKKNPYMPPPLLSALFGSILSLVLLSITNLFYKASAHTTGISGLAGIYFGYALNFIVIPDIFIFINLILLIGIIGSVRIFSGAHRPYEIYLGILLGFVPSFLCIYFRMYI